MFTDFIISAMFMILGYVSISSIGKVGTGNGNIRKLIGVIFIIVAIGWNAEAYGENVSDTTIVFSNEYMTTTMITTSIDKDSVTDVDVIEMMNHSQHLIFMSLTKSKNFKGAIVYVAEVKRKMTFVTVNRVTVFHM